jgi:hypothetical protein
MIETGEMKDQLPPPSAGDGSAVAFQEPAKAEPEGFSGKTIMGKKATASIA